MSEDEASPHAVGNAPLPGRFWLYTAFTAVSMLGFATFAVFAYHDQAQHVMVPALIPVTYAVAMGADALAALGSGWLYDRIGLRGLIVALPLTVLVPLFAFQDSPGLIWVGAVVWGTVMGVHESTLRAAVADLVPAARRGTAYGIFTATYGVAWLAGSTMIGALYSVSITAVVAFVAATQIAALALFVPLIQRESG